MRDIKRISVRHMQLVQTSQSCPECLLAARLQAARRSRQTGVLVLYCIIDVSHFAVAAIVWTRYGGSMIRGKARLSLSHSLLRACKRFQVTQQKLYVQACADFATRFPSLLSTCCGEKEMFIGTIFVARDNSYETMFLKEEKRIRQCRK